MADPEIPEVRAELQREDAPKGELSPRTESRARMWLLVAFVVAVVAVLALVFVMR